jgi:hypothetical protein
MKRRDSYLSKEEERLLQEYYQRLGPVDRIYVLHPFVKEKPKPLPLPIRTRIRNFFVGIRQNRVFGFFAAIGRGIYLILALQLLLLLPVMINKCSVRPPLY